MKKLISNKPFVITLAVFIITIGYFVYVAGEGYKLNGMISLEKCNKHTDFDLLNEIKSIDSSNIINDFPYNDYLKYSNYCDINNLLSHIQILDSMYHNTNEITIPILYTTLTDSLSKTFTKEHEVFNPQLLINQLYWAKNMKAYESYFVKYDLIFAIVYEYWMSHITNLLEIYFVDNKNLKYDFRFKLLLNECSLENYNISLGMRYHEKIADYLIQGKYSYIWSRFYNGTGWIVKVCIIILILFNLFCINFTLNNFIKKKIKLNKKKQNHDIQN